MPSGFLSLHGDESARLADLALVQVKTKRGVVQVTMDAGSHARVKLQQSLAAAGLQPERANKYLCGFMLDTSRDYRYAFKHRTSGKEFTVLRKVVNRETSRPLDRQPSCEVRNRAGH